MKKYAKIIDRETGLCSVGLGNNEKAFREAGLVLLDVEESDVDNDWYLADKCPHKTNEQKLQEAKQEKLAENALKRDERLLAGVTYKDVLFDSDTDSKANLTFAFMGMDDTQTVIWLGKDNQPLECNKQDIYNIGNAIGAMTVQVWSVKNPYYLQAIENAETIEELEAIVIDYEAE